MANTDCSSGIGAPMRSDMARMSTPAASNTRRAVQPGFSIVAARLRALGGLRGRSPRKRTSASVVAVGVGSVVVMLVAGLAIGSVPGKADMNDGSRDAGL